MEQAIGLADVLVAAAHEVSGALRALGADGDPTSHLVEVHHLETTASAGPGSRAAGLSKPPPV